MITFETILEILSMLVSLVFIRYTKQKAFRWITFILTITALNEAAVIPFILKYHPSACNIDYNLFSLLDMLSWFAFFTSLFQKNRMRPIIIVLAALNFIYAATELFVLRGWYQMHSDSLRAYEVTLIGISVYYLFLILKKEYHNLWIDSIFWVCIACILYNSIGFVNFTTLNEGDNYWTTEAAHQTYDIVQNMANSSYYLLLCAAFFVIFYNHKQKIQP